LILPTPVYRFFSKKEHLNDLVINGRMRFTPTSAFGELKDMNYRDEGENYYHFKIREDKSHTIIVDGKERLIEGGTVHSTYRKIDDAWAFCCSTSIVSTARKPYSAYIKNFGRLIQKLDEAIKAKFNEKLLIMFGPVAYYDRHMDLFSEVNPPPYFSKEEKFKTDLEFRIVIVPSDKIYESGKLDVLTLEINEPIEIFGQTTIIDKK